ncbi:MAG: LCP family protein [Treponema sp.]|nr:LCP family protein [Treponema sp.]MCL2237921.1 LCP family protein [Treponema sp.]
MRIIKGDASILLLVLIVFILGFGIIISMHTFQSNPIADAISDNRVINVLFVIEHEKMPLSTYVLMYYPNTKRAAIFDIPGDLGLLITSINRVDRIDRVYNPGRIGSYQNEIQKLLGIEINFSIVITKENLVSIVDLLEGVQIFIPSRVFHRDDDEIILFPSGMTVLDGDKASLYATYSLPHEDSELSVFRRQRFFLGYLGRQIQMNENLKNSSAAKMYYSLFRTSMSQRTLMYLFDEFVHIDTDRTNIQSVGGMYREVSGQQLIIPHHDGNLIKEIVRQTLVTLTREVEDHLVERTLTVEVLNGTAVTGLAGRTAELLRSFGYDVIAIGNADRNNYDNTLIVHYTGDDELVADFSGLLRCRNIRREEVVYNDDDSMLNQNIDFKANVTLIIGRDFNERFVVGN